MIKIADSAIIVGTVAAIAALQIVFRSRNRNATSQELSAFAETHGCQYNPVGTLSGSAGSIFSTGRNKRVTNEVIHTSNNESWRLFHYKYTLGYGHSQYNEIFTVLEFEVGDRLPQLLIKPIPRLDIEIKVEAPVGYQRLILEGNFDHSLHAFIAPGSQIGALQILTPDIMEFLIDANTPYDIELADTKIILSRSGFDSTSDKLDRMLDFGKHLTEQINPVAGRMHFESAPVETRISAAKWHELLTNVITVGVIVLILGMGVFVVWLLDKVGIIS